MLDQELEELDRLADVATPGPWEWHPRHGTVMGDFQSPRGSICDFGDATQYYPTEGTPPSDEDAAFIAAANPKTIKALISDNRALKAALLKADAICEHAEENATEPAELAQIKAVRLATAELLQKGGGDG